MRASTGKAIFASLAVHAGVVAAAVHMWTVPERAASGPAECFGACLFSPPLEVSLFAEKEDFEMPVDEVAEDAIPQDIENEPAPMPAELAPEIESATQPPQPPPVAIPSRVIGTQSPKPAPSRKAGRTATQPPSGKLSGSASGGVNRSGGNVAAVPPQLRYKAAPAYRETTATRGRRLTVWVTLDVDVHGRVGAVRIKSSCGFEELDSAAAAAARRYRFKPAHSGGEPIAWTFDHAITFAP